MTKSPMVDELLNRIGQALREREETLESMLVVLREERARVFAERYPKASDEDAENEETE